MFGFSLSELIVVIVVAVVVIGPKDLPKMLRKLGQYAGKLRRMASELRAQSGIDDALRTEGLADDINEIRKLARGELDDIRRDVSIDPVALAAGNASVPIDKYAEETYVARDREWPRDGADAYGALPDNAIVYAEGMPKSKHARDPLYVLGDADGVLPPEPEKTDEAATEEHVSPGADTASADAVATEAAADEAATDDKPVPREDATDADPKPRAEAR